MKGHVPRVQIVRFALATATALVAVVPSAAQEETENSSGASVDSGLSPGAQAGYGEYTDCRPSYIPMVFDGGYGVSLCYETAEGVVAAAQGGIWASGQSGLLWFFDVDNAEVLVKVLNGCSYNGHRWVFVAPVTDVAFNLHVTSSSGRQWTHRNRLGETAATRSDTSAFVCSEDDASTTSVAAAARPGIASGQTVAVSPLARGEYTDCRPTTTPLVFDGGYQVSMCYETAEGAVGEARAGIWASNQSGLLWFFNRDNAEVLVKVLDGCSHNGSRWIFVAPVTDVAFNLRVTSVGGRVWTHRNRLGVTASTKSDTSAFDCATEDGIQERVSVFSASAAEGDVVEFAVRQSGVSTADTVLGWSTAGGTARSGVDFRAVTAGTLTIAAGETTGTLRVSTVEDTQAESDETFTVTLTGTVLPPGVSLGVDTATGTIVNDDGVTVSVFSASAAEGDVVEFAVRQSGVSTADTVLGWSTAGGTARSGVDFRAVTAGTLTIAAGETTGTLRVSTVEDTQAESDETFTVTLTGTVLPPGVSLGVDTATGTIVNDDGVTVSVFSASAAEGDVVEFAVRQSGVSTADTVLGWSTAGGTARSGVDFRAVTAGTLTIAAGETTGTLRVSTVEDTQAESDETFTVTLTGTVLPPGVSLGVDTATGMIVNDDAGTSPGLIPDAGLRSAIEAALGLESGEQITLEALETLTVLEAVSADVRDLAGLELATGLTRLIIQWNDIGDLSPLAGLTELTVLLASHNSIEELSPLANLTKLETLYLSRNVINDVSPLAGLTALTSLELGYNGIEDVRPLAGLTELTHLALQDNAIEEVSSLAGLTNLGQLRLDINRVEDVRPLSGLNSLRTLSLGNNRIEDVSPLGSLSGLRSLSLASNRLDDVSALAGLTSLRNLVLDTNDIQGVSPLTGLLDLRRLYLQFNLVEDVSSLVDLQELEELDLRGNPLDRESVEVHVATLAQRDVDVQFDWFKSKRHFDIELVFLENFSDAQRRLVEWAARRWMAVLSEDMRDIVTDRALTGSCDCNSYEIPTGERIDDVRVYVTGSLEPWGPNGWAGVKSFRNDDEALPYVSCINLDLTSDSSHTAVHEFAHALGFTSTLPGWQRFLRESDDGVWHFGGPLAIAAFRDAGGSGYSGPGVPLRKGDASHWGGVVSGEVMGIQQDARNRPLSAITIQALADIGYGVDVTQADEYVVPGFAAIGSVGEAGGAEGLSRLLHGSLQAGGAVDGSERECLH